MGRRSFAPRWGGAAGRLACSRSRGTRPSAHHRPGALLKGSPGVGDPPGNRDRRVPVRARRHRSMRGARGLARAHGASAQSPARRPSSPSVARCRTSWNRFRWPRSSVPALSCCWNGRTARACRLAAPERLVIGPEGGFSMAEVSAAEASGATIAGLGPRILRSESVAPALPRWCCRGPETSPWPPRLARRLGY